MTLMPQRRSERKTTLVVGVDLAGSPKRNTGICVLRGMTVTSCATLHTDEEILAFIDRARPELVDLSGARHGNPA